MVGISEFNQSYNRYSNSQINWSIKILVNKAIGKIFLIEKMYIHTHLSIYTCGKETSAEPNQNYKLEPNVPPMKKLECSDHREIFFYIKLL